MIVLHKLLESLKKYFQKNSEGNLLQLQLTLGYYFKKSELLEMAVTHKSFANEMQHENCFGNERLEFLGDAVLELVVSHILMERSPNDSEGRLSSMRAAIVNKEALASLALKLNIDKYILLSKGEDESRGRKKKSILANVYEAIIAAVYYDGGYAAVSRMIEAHFSGLLQDVSGNGYLKDYKSRLQEYSQKTFGSIPQYNIIDVSGPNHRRIFETLVVINDTSYGKGIGTNKKKSEQEAASRTLKILLKD